MSQLSKIGDTFTHPDFSTGKRRIKFDVLEIHKILPNAIVAHPANDKPDASNYYPRLVILRDWQMGEVKWA